MTWVKLDDQFQDHPKFLALSLGAIGLWAAGLAYCSRYLTDGFITSAACRRIGGTKKLVAELVAAGLWEPQPDGGWCVHDYLEFNPSSDQVRDVREKRAEAGRRGGMARGQQKQAEANSRQLANQVADPLLSPRPVPSRPVSEVSELRDYASSSTAGDDDDQLALEAATELGRRKHLRALTAGRVNGNAVEHERSCIANAITEKGEAAHAWHAVHPDATIADIVNHLDPPRPNGRASTTDRLADLRALKGTR